ncbi:DUF6385 domain-containing protein [Anaerovorax sp. IOR16]|uniref:DUF6385 domain-containing protein n=1 Tax=Anaerovorax sp. IOR16 TaxID=2773458 RepID=UPI0019D2E10E|nr:DUF6385 domain-containing protein [Anaerovorax sp. IOR16]
MPGMPIFQNSPSQLKGQIYVVDNTTDNVVPLHVDNSGNLPVNFAADSTIDTVNTVNTVTAVTDITNDVSIINGATPLNVGTVTAVTDITNDVGIINGTTPLNVGLSAGTNVIGKVQNDLIFTNVDSFGAGTILTPKTVDETAAVVADAQDISQQSSYNWFIKNTGSQDITLVVKISPDNTNWMDDTGDTITVAVDESKMITVTNFLKYASFTIAALGAGLSTTVISCFQAQH